MDEFWEWNPGEAPTRWRPSIYMPKEAARLFLRITDVRVERLQEITEDDAIAEGVNMSQLCMPVVEFRDLWDGTHAKDGEKWDDNPWVWVYTFERCKKEEE